MQQVDMLAQVATELTHIPLCSGEHQGLLRAIYRLFRVNSLSEKVAGSAGAVLRRSITTVWRDYPRARLDYDRAFFNN
jgi:hypothetical protein